MKNTSKKDFSVELLVLREAQDAAIAAAKAMIDQNPGSWYPCGFSSVTVRPARGRMVEAMKHFEVGHVDQFNGGFVVYNPSATNSQWLDAKAAGSRAYADRLNQYFKETNSACVAKSVNLVD